MIRWVSTVIVILWSATAWAEEVTVAVASNFLTTAEALAQEFQDQTGHSVVLSHGSTGQLFSQIEFGAPYDVYLAADQERPAALLAGGQASETATYALGLLVVASKIPLAVDTAAESFEGRTVALADPTVAPYGKAATTAMERLKLDTATFRPVLVANVGQAGAIFSTGNADIAFVARSQLPILDAPFNLDLDGLIAPLPQDAALLKRADDNPAAQAFWDWLTGPDARQIITDAGYGLPGE